MRDRFGTRIVMRIVQCVSFFIASQFLVLAALWVIGSEAQETDTRGQGYHPVSVNAHELPPAQYARLKSLAISNASARLGSRQQNPRISRDGMDESELAVLKEQRRYLKAVSEPNQQPSAGERTAVMGGPLITFSVAPCISPLIAAVNGRVDGAVFTPRITDNQFRIEGCGFGGQPGEVFLRPEVNDSSPGSFEQAITLQPSTWSETAIDARMDPSLAGLPDSLVTLVVRLPDGRTVELAGCRFVATRGTPIPLKTIPASWVKLGSVPRSVGLQPELEYISPPIRGSEVPPSASKFSALVVRWDSNLFATGTDVFDFSGLANGWAVESVQVQKYSLSCPGDVTQSWKSGDWSTTFNERGFSVAWGTEGCFSFIPPIFGFSLASSEYAVHVWVTGPVGTEPIHGGHKQELQKHAFTNW